MTQQLTLPRRTGGGNREGPPDGYGYVVSDDDDGPGRTEGDHRDFVVAGRQARLEGEAAALRVEKAGAYASGLVGSELERELFAGDIASVIAKFGGAAIYG